MDNSIASLKAREIIDSRGNPTIEVEAKLKSGLIGVASVPSGASTGIFEAVELRDGGKRFLGKGVLNAIKNITEVIQPKIVGLEASQQRQIDEILIKLDGTENKSKLGGNAILGVSIACAKAAAIDRKQQLYEYINHDACLLPIPFFNIVNGGKHAGNQIDFQEFMIAPTGATNFREALRIGVEVYQILKMQLQKKYGKNAINVGDEGGFAPPMKTTEEVIDSIIEAIKEAGYDETVKIALDVASSTFYKDEFYTIAGKKYSTPELIDVYKELIKKYPIISIEDPIFEEDYEGFVEITKALPIQILGDDIFVTNSQRLRKGIEMGAANALLWKVNQIGTLTEAIDAANMAKNHNYRVMASHRSGDTEDSWVSDLSVAIECGQIKSGAPARGERTAKYNQLLRIEERLGNKAKFPKNIF
ncbi:phosphopyruvate hydratase [Candidatus Bathyarchaeota archaeon]|nr:phosphopyruvate hydratase [Candidatus Bathyarchaeota archaeon]